VGYRVVVRRVVGARHGRPLYSDALGELTELTDDHLTVVTARGPLRVPLTEVARAKRVPPRPATPAGGGSGRQPPTAQREPRPPTAQRAPQPPTAERTPRPPAAEREPQPPGADCRPQPPGPRSAEIAALELAANEAWPAPDHERLGDWLLRAAGGWTGRGNSALPVGDPGRPLDSAIDAVQDWYAARGLPPKINVPLPLAAPVNAALDARGWHTSPRVLVQTTPLADLQAATAGAGRPPVRLSEAPSKAWLDLAAGRKGEVPAAGIHILTAVRQVRFAEVYGDDGELSAIARGTVTGAGRYFGIFLVEVVPAARRRGLARQVIGALAEWAGRLGATTAFLQVEAHNAAARALYERLGFTTHHEYVNRTAPL
jgi:GNAT superfamily N-acetyltransferase